MTEYFRVTIEPSGKTIFVKPGESILTAGLRQSFDLPFSCQEGECATCMGRLLEGNISYPSIEPCALTEAETQQGHVLTCCSVPMSDCIIWLEGISAPEDLPRKTMTCPVKSITALNGTMSELIITTPDDQPLKWLAGQYVQLSNRVAGDSRPYTIASHGGNELHFFIQHSIAYNEKFLAQIKACESVTINGPHGDCVYRREPELPLLLVAGGAGFAQSAALLEAIAKDDYQQPVHLFWGVRNESDFHSDAMIASYQAGLPNLQITRVVSELINNAVSATYPDLSGKRCYVSGSAEMVNACYQSFITAGLNDELFMSDLKPQ